MYAEPVFRDVGRVRFWPWFLVPVICACMGTVGGLALARQTNTVTMERACQVLRESTVDADRARAAARVRYLLSEGVQALRIAATDPHTQTGRDSLIALLETRKELLR